MDETPHERALRERWVPICKGKPVLYLEFGGGGRCHQWCNGIEARATAPIELRLDLSLNLRVQNKHSNQFTDARELAGGAIARLELLQVEDQRGLERLRSLVGEAENRDRPWTLTVELQGVHQFRVDPEAPKEWPGRLYLWVVDDGGERVSEWGRKRA